MIKKFKKTTRNKIKKEKKPDKKKKEKSNTIELLRKLTEKTMQGVQGTYSKGKEKELKKDYKIVAYESRGLDPDFDQYRFCEICKAKGEMKNALEIHHIEGRRGEKYNDPKNLIFVCRDCHDNAHKYPVDMLQKIVLDYLI